YTVTATQVTQVGGGSVTYAGAENLTVNGGFAADSFDVRSTAAGTRTLLNGGGGGDYFRVGNGANPLHDIQGTVTLNGGGNDSLSVDEVNFMDQGSAGRSYTLRADQILARTGSALIAYAEMERLTLNSGDSADSVAVLATVPGMPVTLNLGGGDD